MPRELDPNKVYEFEKGMFGEEEAERRRKLKEMGKDPNASDPFKDTVKDRFQKIKNLFGK